MMLLEMKMFCGSDNSRAKMSEPFTRGEYTYATNGRVAIRVPKIIGVEDVSEAPKAERLIWGHEGVAEWLALPQIDLERASTCTACNGSGFAVECLHCEEMIPLPKGGHVCRECFGCGVDIMEKVQVGDDYVAVRYVELLRTLPECVIALPLKDDGMYLFKADGVDGLLMGLAKDF